MSDSPTRIALFANHLLVPEQVGRYGVLDGSEDLLPVRFETGAQVRYWPRRAATWLLRCLPGDEAFWPECAFDRDGDGFPTDGDCDDTDPDVHPDALDQGFLPIDVNCDGWQTFAPGDL